jgi:hypothetical protein
VIKDSSLTEIGPFFGDMQGMGLNCGKPARRSSLLGLLAAALLAIPAWAQIKPADLSQDSIEDLMNYEVTSVAKKSQKISQAGPLFL